MIHSKQLILLLPIILLVVNFVEGASYSIHPAPETIKISNIEEDYIIKGKDADVNITLHLFILSDFLKYNKDFELIISSLQLLRHHLPATGFKACLGNADCSEIPYTKKFWATNDYSQPLYSYRFNLSVPEIGTGSHIIRINYKVPNFVIQQGDNQVLWLSTSCPLHFLCPEADSNAIRKWIELPTETSVPISFPDASRVTMIKGRWAFIIYGGLNENQFVWYKDEAQIKRERRFDQFLFTLLGAGIGFLFPLLISWVRRNWMHTGSAKESPRFKYKCRICKKGVTHYIDSKIGREHKSKFEDEILYEYIASMLLAVVGGAIAGLIVGITFGLPLDTIDSYIRIGIAVITALILGAMGYPAYRRFKLRLRAEK